MQVVRGLHRATRPAAITIGNFDGVHLGHRALLKQLHHMAAQRGLETAVMVFEPHPLEFFTPQQAPTRLTSLREKLELFADMQIDRVYICRFNRQFAAISPQQFVQTLHQQLQARFVLIGDDFRFGSHRGGDFALLQQMGAQLGFEAMALDSVLQQGVRISSTAIRQALAAGQLDTAQSYLGREYSISGRVCPGDRLGRELGYPTANIPLRHNRPPLSGIYVVRTEVAGVGLMDGVASIGVRPTVKHNARPLLEVHLFDFDQDIYARHLRVAFLHKLRDEQKFDGLQALVQQIEQDACQARAWFERQHVM